jgi:site-specific DNA-cytosine methylase
LVLIGGKSEIASIKDILPNKCVDKLGFNSTTTILDVSDFGLPQKRLRTIILAWRPSWWEVGITGHNLKGGHPRTIPPKFGCNWSSGF